jgi:hypothetical protein
VNLLRYDMCSEKACRERDGGRYVPTNVILCRSNEIVLSSVFVFRMVVLSFGLIKHKVPPPALLRLVEWVPGVNASVRRFIKLVDGPSVSQVSWIKKMSILSYSINLTTASALPFHPLIFNVQTRRQCIFGLLIVPQHSLWCGGWNYISVGEWVCLVNS